MAVETPRRPRAESRLRAEIRALARLWRLFGAMDLLWISRGLRDAVTWVIADIVTRVAGATTTILLAARFDGIGRWTPVQILFMLGYAMAVGGLLDVLFGYNMRMISRRIGRGQLDHMLVQPHPLWRLMISEGLMPFSQPLTVLVAIGIMIWAVVAGLPVALSVGWILLVLLDILASSAIVFAFQLGWGSLAFWAPRTAEEINSTTGNTMGLGNLPLDSVPRALLGVLVTVVPIGFVAWLPARSITGVTSGFAPAALTPLAAPVFVAVAVLIFRKGLRHYVRVGSSRYSPFGHRR